MDTFLQQIEQKIAFAVQIYHSVINFFYEKYAGHQLLTVKQLTRVEIRNRSSVCQISPSTQVNHR